MIVSLLSYTNQEVTDARPCLSPIMYGVTFSYKATESLTLVEILLVPLLYRVWSADERIELLGYVLYVGYGVSSRHRTTGNYHQT